MSDKVEPMFAVVELLGHQRMAGRVSEVSMFGSTLGRVEIPTGPDAWQTVYFGGAAVFRISPCDEATARAVAASCRPEPVHAYELPRLPQPVPEDPGEFAEVRREREEDYTDGPDSVEDDDEPPY